MVREAAGAYDRRFARSGDDAIELTGVALDVGTMKKLTRWIAGVAVCILAAATARPASAEPRVIVELFTSQGCSSCPAADRILGDLAKDPNVIALTLPIDYWDYLGWKDTLADPRSSARQKAYSKTRGDRDVFTPQMVVNGGVHVVGNDRARIDGAIAASHAAMPDAMGVTVSLAQAGKIINVNVAGKDGARGEVWICAVSKAVPIAIARGENRGKQVVYHNVVRNWLKVGDFSGAETHWTVPIENVARDGVDAAVVYLQDGTRDTPGAMLGAAMTSLH